MLAWLNDISYELKFPFVGSGDFKIYIYKEKETKGMKNEMKKKNNKGFSLVELIVVIAIMAVLMVVLAPAMLRYVEKTREQKDDSAVSEARNAVELALAQEDINTALGGATTVTVTVKGSNGEITASATGGTSPDTTKLLADVKATVGDTISMSSKSRKADTYVITAEYKPNREAYVVNGL